MTRIVEIEKPCSRRIWKIVVEVCEQLVIKCWVLDRFSTVFLHCIWYSCLKVFLPSCHQKTPVCCFCVSTQQCFCSVSGTPTAPARGSQGARKRTATKLHKNLHKNCHNRSNQCQEHPAIPHSSPANNATISQASRELRQPPKDVTNKHQTTDNISISFFTLPSLVQISAVRSAFHHVLEMLQSTAVFFSCAPASPFKLAVQENRFELGPPCYTSCARPSWHTKEMHGNWPN